LVAAAGAQNIDPLLVMAVSAAASGGNPAATLENGGIGLLGVRQALAAEGDMLGDPARNAAVGVSELARLAAAQSAGAGAGANPDWNVVLASYYAADDASLSDAAANFATRVLAARAQLDATHPVIFSNDPTPNSTPTPSATSSSQPSAPLGTGMASYYSPSYDTAWWERTLQQYANAGNIAPGWQPDPNGYYCVRPGLIPGQRLALTANGVTIACTIGDTVAAGDVKSWLTHWVVELNYPAFIALGLDRSNTVTITPLGPRG
jgi:hypothetical protein